MKIFSSAMLLALSSTCMAATIELAFRGRISTVSSDPGVTPPFHVGDLWTLALTYEYPHPPDQLALGQARYAVVGDVDLAVNNLDFTATEFGVSADIPSSIHIGGIATLGQVPVISLGYRLSFSSTKPLI